MTFQVQRSPDQMCVCVFVCVCVCVLLRLKGPQCVLGVEGNFGAQQLRVSLSSSFVGWARTIHL